MLQRWLHNRNGCTAENIRYFKSLDEKMKLVNFLRESDATKKSAGNTDKKALNNDNEAQSSAFKKEDDPTSKLKENLKMLED